MLQYCHLLEVMNSYSVQNVSFLISPVLIDKMTKQLLPYPLPPHSSLFLLLLLSSPIFSFLPSCPFSLIHISYNLQAHAIQFLVTPKMLTCPSSSSPGCQQTACHAAYCFNQSVFHSLCRFHTVHLYVCLSLPSLMAGHSVPVSA